MLLHVLDKESTKYNAGFGLQYGNTMEKKLTLVVPNMYAARDGYKDIL